MPCSSRKYGLNEENRIVSEILDKALIFTMGKNRLFFFNGEKK